MRDTPQGILKELRKLAESESAELYEHPSHHPASEAAELIAQHIAYLEKINADPTNAQLYAREALDVVRWVNGGRSG